MSPSRTLLIFFLVLVVLAGCAKRPTIIRGGVEMPVDQAAKMDFDRAELLYQKKQYTAASKKFFLQFSKVHDNMRAYPVNCASATGT